MKIICTMILSINQNFKQMKDAIILITSLLLSVNTIRAQTSSSINIPLPSEQEMNFRSTSLDETRFDKSYVTNDSLYHKSLIGSEKEQINNVLIDYIEGTANGEPDRLKEAFHEDFNLYFVKKDSLQIWSGKHYVHNVKRGVKSNRIGKVVSIDYEKDAAMAKIEILMPDRQLIYTDYLMLLKINDHWKIIHKSFTYKKCAS